ncbi:MAG: stage III sporulation protein AF [Clostridiaceae bacterium]
MEYIKQWVISISFTLIFITAGEMLIVKDSFKKYVRFALGIILIIAMLKPILQIFGDDSESFISQIINNEVELQSSDFTTANGGVSYSNTETKIRIIENLQENANAVLKSKFKDFDFSSEFKGDIDLEKYSLEIVNINIFVSSKKVKSVDEVDIDFKDGRQEAQIKEKEEIKSIISDEFQVTKDKVKVFLK